MGGPSSILSKFVVLSYGFIFSDVLLVNVLFFYLVSCTSMVSAVFIVFDGLGPRVLSFKEFLS